jgi:hypothetical protein
MTARLFASAAVLVLSSSAAGQSGGDYDGDGDVDGDDFWYWSGCMTGPAGSLPDPNCAAFDFDLSLGDGKVDLADLAAFGRAFTGPPCMFGKKYAGVRKLDFATGCSAKIRTRPTTLCGEPSNDRWACSSASAGATKTEGGQPVKWGQMGYLRWREDGSLIVKTRVYAETQAGPNMQTDYEKWYYNSEPNEPSAGTHAYKCYITSPISGRWNYDYDGANIHYFVHDGWKNVLGTQYQWQGEIHNKEDQMVGTATAKCDFTQCQFATNYTFQDADIGSGDVHSDDLNEWGIERTSATGFNIWDKKP